MQINLCPLNVKIHEICKPAWKENLFFLDEVFISMTKMDFHQFYCSEMLMIML